MHEWLGGVNVGNFVTLKLLANIESNNYASWKVQVLSLIQSHDLMGFVDGSIRIPDERPKETTYGGKAYDRWRTDKVVRGWILGAISEPVLLLNLANHSTTRKVWLYLERRFDKGATSSVVSQSQDKDSLDDIKTPLMEAVQKDKWEAALQLLDTDPHAATNWTYDDSSILLEEALKTQKAICFLEKLLECIPDDKLIAINHFGGTVLHSAAALGNKEAAEMLVERKPGLCYIPQKKWYFPVHSAARYKRRAMLEYMLQVTKHNKDNNPYASITGLRLLKNTIDAEYFDIAIDLVNKYSGLAEVRDSDETALTYITRRSAFSNERRFGSWESFLSSCVPGTTITLMFSKEHNDIESGNPDSNQKPGSVCQKLNVLVWKILEQIAPHHIRNIKEKSRANQQALQLVRLLCNNIKSRTTYENAIFLAATLDVCYVVEKIIDTFPSCIRAIQYPINQSLFHIAIENRSEYVFNLIHQQMSGSTYLPFGKKKDANGNNLLHLAGKLAPAHKLNKISGAALQMQRELQWFKEVGNSIHPSARVETNEDGKTPEIVFTEEHKKLKEDGEKWMKDTANSCTISAALIATVMFAAAITVPGGNDGSRGYPIFYNTPAFIIFAVSDAISLFASATSLLLFLAILTSRYAEQDFLRALPKRLIFGLATLFLSITFMMVSFSATLFLVFGQQKLWVLFPVLILACLPITSFVLLQFPIMVDLISSTYGRGIFSKKSKRPLY